MVTTREQQMDKIQKLLAKSKNNPSQEEVQAVLLLAQKLMVKWGIEQSEIELQENVKFDKVIEQETIKGRGTVAQWKKSLAWIISRNFKCKWYFDGLNRVVFFGLKDDVHVCASIYRYAVDAVDKGMYKCYRSFRDKGLVARGVRGDYVLGFLNGLEDAFKKQVKEEGWGLVLVIHPEVENAYEALNLKTKKSKASFTECQGNAVAYNKGRSDGASFAGFRSQLDGEE